MSERRMSAVQAGRARGVLPVLRVLVAGVVLVAVFAQLGVLITYWHRIGLHDIGLRVGNFFSAFTYEVALLAAAMLVVGAIRQWRRGGAVEPARVTIARLCVVAAAVLTGTVYNLLLRGIPPAAGSQLDWANDVVHVWLPIALLIDWVAAPGRARLRFRVAPLVLVYPIAWLVYTMVRGVLVPDELEHTPYFYPYPFLDPHAGAGWPGIAVIVAVLIGFTYVVGLVLLLVARLPGGRRS